MKFTATSSAIGGESQCPAHEMHWKLIQLAAFPGNLKVVPPCRMLPTRLHFFRGDICPPPIHAKNFFLKQTLALEKSNLQAAHVGPTPSCLLIHTARSQTSLQCRSRRKYCRVTGGGGLSRPIVAGNHHTTKLPPCTHQKTTQWHQQPKRTLLVYPRLPYNTHSNMVSFCPPGMLCYSRRTLCQCRCILVAMQNHPRGIYGCIFSSAQPLRLHRRGGLNGQPLEPAIQPPAVNLQSLPTKRPSVDRQHLSVARKQGETRGDGGKWGNDWCATVECSQELPLRRAPSSPCRSRQGVLAIR